MVEEQVLARRRDNLRARARIIEAIRHFFADQQYLEVETPVRIPAPAPETHIDAIPSGHWFLQTSPELCMKRMLAAGYPRIFQIVKCFRQGERGVNHLPEFTMLEWYRADINYRQLMEECEDLFLFVARFLGGDTIIPYQGLEIDITKPWKRISVRDAFRLYSPMPLHEALQDDRFDEMMVLHVEPGFSPEIPVFLYDYPVSLGSLARAKKEDPTVAERFEIYVGGLELANAFSELTDVDEQTKRFEQERGRRRKFDKTTYPVPDKFLYDLRRMPESAGIALGIDRLVMLFTDTLAIDDVVTFTPEEL